MTLVGFGRDGVFPKVALEHPCWRDLEVAFSISGLTQLLPNVGVCDRGVVGPYLEPVCDHPFCPNSCAWVSYFRVSYLARLGAPLVVLPRSEHGFFASHLVTGRLLFCGGLVLPPIPSPLGQLIFLLLTVG